MPGIQSSSAHWQRIELILHGGMMMQVLFLRSRHVYWLIGFFLVVVLTGGIVLNWDRLNRQLVGVKPGVRVAGYPCQGMLPQEVARIVKALASKVETPARNAIYFPETGEIIPAQSGKVVDIATNVNRVCLAPPHSNIQLKVERIPASVSEDFFKAVYHGNPGQPRVALAINVAWGEEYLPEILKVLEAAKIKATFFLVGSWVKVFPEKVKELGNAGHELANHGLYHGHPQQMGSDELRRLIVNNQSLITALTGCKPVKYFAPPYGELNTTILGVAGNLGYRTIMWSVDSVDWKLPAPEILIQRVISKIEPGGIILLHPTIVTQKALPDLIRELRAKGLEPGTVSSVLPGE